MAHFSNGPDLVEYEDANMETHVPLVSSYNDHIRPLLDAVDKLRHLKIMNEGIKLPTIVVVGDQSSGKSSVLESLAGINLPRGQGICTRVPLVMRLQHQPTPTPEVFLEFNGKTVYTDEARAADAISLATDEIAGDGKGISNTPLTLVVKKKGIPDLTMIDLPGITRVPVHGQPEDIYEQIAGIVTEYIRPEESIILNVLSATVDFPTCESIRMSRQVDKTGERTLAVVTKSDKEPEGLLEKVAADDLNIGLAKCLPDIARNINEKLNASISELNKMPRTPSSLAEAMTAFIGIVGSAKESLRKILIGGEFDEYLNDHQMHCTARLVEMLNLYSYELHNCSESDPTRNFLVEEIRVLEESRGIKLPNFLPHGAFLSILQRKVDGISRMPIDFVEKIWAYIESVVLSVLTHHSENYHQLQLSTSGAAKNLISKMKEQSISWVTEIIQMEKMTDYTCSPDYMSEWSKLMNQQDTIFRLILTQGYSKVKIEGIGEVEAGHIKAHQNVLHQAFDLKMRMTAYWMIVLRRLVESMALHLQFSVQNLVKQRDGKGDHQRVDE
ncbi:hypothetical protein GH714_010675 [Hevea brasiliensis]|uniref:Dynamin-type G domain-containing protein n=1 Tax=Hevea brasiliensis TaxID=3981 RepID=A0A6A6MHX4_HEVBR|nr:hypothetical protein GH714_010675 [Hevea brasiliensis]